MQIQLEDIYNIVQNLTNTGYIFSSFNTGTECPIGSYGNQTGLTSALECPLCDPGWYCPTIGLTEPYQECTAGYYCELGATSPNPANETYGYYCPVGHYCPQGIPTPQTCPAGTYNPYVGKCMLVITVSWVLRRLTLPMVITAL